MSEQAVLFGRTKSLVGVVTDPYLNLRNRRLPAIIILNAGLLHRIGPNRLYVKMARQLAATGFVVLRFDFSGIGDSSARDDNLPSERSSVSETQEAMHYLGTVKHAEKFILIGVCSGADVAFRTACCDPRVVGAIGINGSYCDSKTLEDLNQNIKSSIQGRYYRKQLLDYRSWWRIITGKSNLNSITRFLVTKARGMLSRNENMPIETNPSIEWDSLIERGVGLFLIYSEGSTALDAFRMLLANRLSGLRESGDLPVEVIEHTDHVFTLLWSQNALMDLINRWIQHEQRSWITC